MGVRTSNTSGTSSYLLCSFGGPTGPGALSRILSMARSKIVLHMGIGGLLLVISGCLDLFEDLLLLFHGRSAVGFLNNVPEGVVAQALKLGGGYDDAHGKNLLGDSLQLVASEAVGEQMNIDAKDTTNIAGRNEASCNCKSDAHVLCQTRREQFLRLTRCLS
jgi:hypothetical protein